MVEHFGKLDITEHYGELLAKNATTALGVSDSPAASYADGVITVSGNPKLAKPSVLQGLGITGIEAWS